MVRVRRYAVVLGLIGAVAPCAVGGDFDGYFKLGGSEGRGFYRIEAFDGPEFVTVLKPTVNALGSAGLPDKVRQTNSERNSLGSVVLFSRTPPVAGAEFSGALYEVTCNLPGVPETFYVASADLRRAILADPAGFFYPQAAQTIRAFKSSGGVMLPASSSEDTSAGEVIGVGPASVLTMQRDGSIAAREISYDAVAADEDIFRTLSQYTQFVAFYCSYLARTRPPNAPSKLSEVLALMGSQFEQDSNSTKIFRRGGVTPFKVVDTDAFLGLAASGENSPVDRVIVICKGSDTLPLGDIAGILSSLAGDGEWHPSEANGSGGATWENARAGLRASLSDRRNILVCAKVP